VDSEPTDGYRYLSLRHHDHPKGRSKSPEPGPESALTLWKEGSSNDPLRLLTNTYISLCRKPHLTPPRADISSDIRSGSLTTETPAYPNPSPFFNHDGLAYTLQSFFRVLHGHTSPEGSGPEFHIALRAGCLSAILGLRNPFNLL